MDDLPALLKLAGPVPDLKRWRASKPVPSLPDGHTNPATEQVLDLIRAALWEERRVSFKVLTIWLAAIKKQPLTVATPRAHFEKAKELGVIQRLSPRRWVHVPSGERIAFDARFLYGVTIDLYGGLDAGEVQRQGFPNTPADEVHERVNRERWSGDAQRAAALDLVRVVLGADFGRDAWPLLSVGHGLLRLLARHRVAVVYEGGILLAHDPARTADPEWRGEGQRWVTIRGLRPMRMDAQPPVWVRRELLGVAA